MTLVTTPGASNADSYASLAEADAYFLARGVTAWTGADAAKEAALRRATSYLDNQYRDRWIGVRTAQAQALAWPRVDGGRGRYRGFTQYLTDADGFDIASDAVPVQVKQAAMEAALLILGGASLEPTLTRGGAIASYRSRVDVIEEETTYSPAAPAVDRYLAIEGLLSGLVTSQPGASGSVVRLVRN